MWSSPPPPPPSLPPLPSSTLPAVPPHTSSTHHVCFLPRSHFAAKDELLFSLLRPEHARHALSESQLGATPLSTLFPLLPLLLCWLETHHDLTQLAALVRALQRRAAAHPVLKLRLLTFLRHHAFPAWHVRTVYMPDAYTRVRAPDVPADVPRVEPQSAHGECGFVIKLAVYCDMVDLHSLHFWACDAFHGNGKAGFDFGYRYVFHPMRVPVLEHHGSPTHVTAEMSQANESQLCEDALVQNVTVRKVFESLSRPQLISLRRPHPGTTVPSDEGHVTIEPAMLLKEGDNLMQDTAAIGMFHVFNHIWRNSPSFQDAPVFPHAYTYDIFPTGLKHGCIEAVPALQALGDIRWPDWYHMHGTRDDGRVLINLVYSAAGAYAAGYVIGASDRHWSNICVMHASTVLHIDFSFLLGDGPPLDAPRISIPPALEHLFRSLMFDQSSVWDVFVAATVDAYLTLRTASTTVLRAANLLFGKAGFDRVLVADFLTGKSGLALNKSDRDAATYLRDKIVTSSDHWKTHVKRFAHDVVNPCLYKFVQEGPLPAEGVRKLIQWYQADGLTTQRLNAKAAKAQLMQVDLANDTDVDGKHQK